MNPLVAPGTGRLYLRRSDNGSSVILVFSRSEILPRLLDSEWHSATPRRGPTFTEYDRIRRDGPFALTY